MKQVKLPENILSSSHFLPLASFFFSAGILLLAGRALGQNAVLRSIFSCQAQGLSGIMPSLKVSYQQGTNLSFLPAGETIKKSLVKRPIPSNHRL